ncbi:MAG: CoB--CoM heterodisulfide reductase iron-sulfur subunit A family protein [Thermodesulfovibrionales bacterium]|nr:CoB--CoM heterodisulfide reductase iron-sulfur subunit A family protein [Thermodesulfovibrionales bacterium]
MAENKKVLVVGGGMSGLTTAIEVAEAGFEAHIVEKSPYLGGRVAQINKYFWKLCPPNCGLEIQFKRIKNNPRMKFYTLAEVESIQGEEGNFDVTINLHPRYVNDKCVGCNACAEACPSYRENDFNFGMDKTKAAYLPHEQAFPFQYVIDAKTCSNDCMKACVEACKYNAIDLDMKPETVNIKVGAVVLATGWNPYDMSKLDLLGSGQIKNVITNMMMERLASGDGPTKGKIIRPSDGKEVKNVAFVQCAGSRDENHLPYCSYICCLASLKHAMYIREQYPDAKVTIYYIDIRTPGLYEQRFYWKIKDDPKVSFVKGKVASIVEEAGSKDVTVVVEDIYGGGKIKETFDMVVLATGMEATTKSSKVGMNIAHTVDGLVDDGALKKGIYAVGTIKNPADVARSVQDATGAAMKSIRSLK